MFCDVLTYVHEKANTIGQVIHSPSHIIITTMCNKLLAVTEMIYSRFDTNADTECREAFFFPLGLTRHFTCFSLYRLYIILYFYYLAAVQHKYMLTSARGVKVTRYICAIHATKTILWVRVYIMYFIYHNNMWLTDCSTPIYYVQYIHRSGVENLFRSRVKILQ